MYGIVVDYYYEDPEGRFDYVARPTYLGVIYPPVNVYVFDEEFDEYHSLRFGTKEEAEKYLAEHESLHESCCYENIRVEEVK